jgi:hypothetical protein
VTTNTDKQTFDLIAFDLDEKTQPFPNYFFGIYSLKTLEVKNDGTCGIDRLDRVGSNCF